ncbi:BrnA antitoxin family protein [Alcaligenaceae bacterium CGII-47]|nr:BrnA antitoxin family protein [Alcaligenaceae bacterium CGII-47]
MSNKHKLIIPTSTEDEMIGHGIAADPDTYELTTPEFLQLKRVGRPPVENPKVQLTVRYDSDVVSAFKAGGPGWQTRMNDALREWLHGREKV